MSSAAPVRVAVVNDYEIVVVGVAAALAPFGDRIRVVEVAAGTRAVSDVDVVLVDTFGQRQRGLRPVTANDGDGARVLVFSWDEDPTLVEASVAAGAAGFVSKRSSAEELVTALERVHAGETVVPARATPDEPQAADVLGRWPGDRLGLSPRESEVLSLICQGLSNDDITEHAFIGINTVKTHIRTLYRKIGVESRTQAVVWGLQHGFQPDRVRVLDS
ncbi:response regulator transcription factor [Nocardioides sp. 1609]|uniref:response regulator transcription factor n=1 Tax=Nocardioides sp. 1609 TaxID=2508327 RepID=UPI00106F7921|nr:response regulator transcription factor [Nocardioides sp. 1609]